MLLDVTYKGLCIGGPSDGAIMEYDEHVVPIPVPDLRKLIPVDEGLEHEETRITYREYFYEEFFIDGERFGFWLYEGTTQLEAFRKLYERYNTE